MRKLLPVFVALAFLFASILNFPDGAVASGVCLIVALPVGFFLLKLSDDADERKMIWAFFAGALVARIVYGSLAYYFDFWLYFAGDAETYNSTGNTLAEYIRGNITLLDDFYSRRFFGFRQSGWGMYYLVAAVYLVTGQNPIAGNFVCAIFGAAAAPIAYLCSKELFSNQRVGLITGLLVAFFPGFINWSSFMMKDGLIVFFLVLSILIIIKLQRSFNLFYLGILLISLLSIISLRFYIFPMIATAILGSFLIGVKDHGSSGSLVRRVILIVGLGLALTYVGAFRSVQDSVEIYGSIEQLNRARLDLSQTADSGFERVDISSAEGAISFLPVGLVYLMLSPFPWQITSIRAALTIPEMLVWWASMPFLFSGVMFSIRNRLRETLPVLIFTLMLTVGYAVFQGNAGTAYRQRTQIQVFHFMFIAVGWILMQEKRENIRLQKDLKRRSIRKPLVQN